MIQQRNIPQQRKIHRHVPNLSRNVNQRGKRRIAHNIQLVHRGDRRDRQTLAHVMIEHIFKG